MLPKKNRLPSYLIPQILKKGRHFPFSWLTLIVSKEPSSRNKQPPRLAIIVPIKIDKRATRRNKIKRQLRQIIKTSLKKIKPGHNVVFLVKKYTIAEKYLSIKAELEKSLKKAKLI